MECSRKALLSILLFFLTTFVFADNFRGKLADRITLTERETVSFSIDSLVGISADTSEGLLQGIELQLSIPPVLRKYRNSFALYMYRGIDRELTAQAASYNGERIHQSILSSNSKEYFQVPLIREHTMSAPAGSHFIETVTEYSQQPLVLTIIPVMKGIPPEVYSASLELSVKPIYLPKGKLDIDLIKKDSGDQISFGDAEIFIDGDLLNGVQRSGTGDIILDSGIHSMRITVPGFNEETTNFSIEQGKTTNLRINLTKSTPRFTLEAPREATVFIDGALFDGTFGRLEEISAGFHSILIKIGDYSMSKKIDFKEGKTYNISLFFDIFIEED